MPHHSPCSVASDKLESGSPPKSPDSSPASTMPSSKASESPDRTAPEVLKWPGLTSMTEDEEANLIPFVRWVIKHRTDQGSCAGHENTIGTLASTLPFVCSELYEYQRREFWTVFYHHFYSMGCPPDLAIRDFVDGARLIDWSKKWGHATILGHSHTYLFLAHDQHPEPAIIPSGLSQHRSSSYWWNFSICEYGAGAARLVQMKSGSPKMPPASVLRWLFRSMEVRQTDCFTLVRLMPGGKAEVADLSFRRYDEYQDTDILHYTDSLVLYVKPRLATKPFIKDPVDTSYPLYLHCGGTTTKLIFVADPPTESSIAKPLLVYLCRLWNLLPSVVAPWMVSVDQEAPPLPGRISITKIISNDSPRFEVCVNVQDTFQHQQQAPTKDASESLWYSPDESPEWNQHAAICQSMNVFPSTDKLPSNLTMRIESVAALDVYCPRFESFYGIVPCRSDGSYCCYDQHCNLEHRCVFCDSCDHGFGRNCEPWSFLVRESDAWHRGIRLPECVTKVHSEVIGSK
eukprot:GILJ01008168.1.p1 GENE.GILJ01008168.1~~GILJ01008168.1.p1  ORF type:complete len:515 (+),score=25.14 GILJ01008168.1:1418-2962(+)